MSHRTDRVSLTPLGPPLPHPLYPPPQRGQRSSSGAGCSQRAGPEPSGDPYRALVVFLSRHRAPIRSIDHIGRVHSRSSRSHHKRTPARRTRNRTAAAVLDHLQNSGISRQLFIRQIFAPNFLFSPPPPECLCTVNVCMFRVTKTCFTKRDSGNWRPGTQTKQNRVKTVFGSEKSFTEKHTHTNWTFN